MTSVHGTAERLIINVGSELATASSALAYHQYHGLPLPTTGRDMVILSKIAKQKQNPLQSSLDTKQPQLSSAGRGLSSVVVLE